ADELAGRTSAVREAVQPVPRLRTPLSAREPPAGDAGTLLGPAFATRLDERGQAGDGWRLVDRPGRSLDRKGLRHEGHQLRRDQRVAAEVKEAVVARESPDTQHLPEDGHEGALDIGLRVVVDRRLVDNGRLGRRL